LTTKTTDVLIPAMRLYLYPTGLAYTRIYMPMLAIQDDPAAAIKALLRGAEVIWDPQAIDTRDLAEAIELIRYVDRDRQIIASQQEETVITRIGVYQYVARREPGNVLALVVFRTDDAWQHAPAGLLDILAARLNTEVAMRDTVDPWCEMFRPAAVYRTLI